MDIGATRCQGISECLESGRPVQSFASGVTNCSCRFFVNELQKYNKMACIHTLEVQGLISHATGTSPALWHISSSWNDVQNLKKKKMIDQCDLNQVVELIQGIVFSRIGMLCWQMTLLHDPTQFTVRSPTCGHTHYRDDDDVGDYHDDIPACSVCVEC